MDKTLSDALALAAHYGLTDREIASIVEAATAARRAEAEWPGAVAMTHPDLPDRRVRVDPEAVPVFEASGWVAEPLDEPEAGDGLPKGNASREEWVAYATRHGLTEGDVEPMSRDQIRDHFQNEES